jgi:hypothetical protein
MLHGRAETAARPVAEHGQAVRPRRRARADDPRAPVPATLVDPYRDHLRARRAGDPAVPVPQLLAEIREQGYPAA